MFAFICKTLILQNRALSLQTNLVRCLQTLQVTNKTPKPTDQQLLTVSYLTNSCGLSLEKAISVSKKIKIENTNKPDSVLQLLSFYGFTKSQIATLVFRSPRIVFANPDRTLKPKLEYVRSLGVSAPDLPMLFCATRFMFNSSLENHIMPTFDFLKGFLGTNENLIHALKQSIRVIGCDVKKRMVPNMNILREHGVPEFLIVKLLSLQPQSLLVETNVFEDVVDSIKKMGFEPASLLFVLAVRSMTTLSRWKWEQKKEILMNFGWSEDDFCLAFKRQPMLMLSSEKKIRELMDFFVEKLGLKAADVVRRPNLLLISLERRVIPRWSVIKVLVSKKLLNEDVDVGSSLIANSKRFEKRFVIPYMDDMPEVMRAYQGGVGHDIRAIGNGFQDSSQ